MFSTKFVPFNNILKSIPQISANTQIVFRLTTNADTLQPVNLSYATYESTTADRPSQAAPLVIMHGLFGSKSNWNSLSKVYQQKCNPQRKVIAVDARNHGDSPHSSEHTYAHLAADLKSLLNQLGVEKAAFMGHSMGGRAVIYTWRINIPALMKNFNNIARFPMVNDVHYDGPVLFVAGGHSDFVQKSDYPKIQKLFPNAELTYIEGAGHWLHSEKPSEFLKITLDFLNRK
ncbi:unnamed protein product [Callosobruchus maculatus]|uniref:sn-1-specific diacylglycerol lipase ABHD11 n=1 Tax=Callosobruchus maculatus TaxID=64391 RepID=A0A653CZ93_CALMS|nr:unnamed protein product [Callosobruchus maculatus]